jgi:hypothetical protein
MFRKRLQFAFYPRASLLAADWGEDLKDIASRFGERMVGARFALLTLQRLPQRHEPNSQFCRNNGNALLGALKPCTAYIIPRNCRHRLDSSYGLWAWPRPRARSSQIGRGTNRAAAYKKLGQLDQSLADDNEAIARDPNVPDYFNHPGLT